MGVIRIEHTENYTIMSNTHLRDSRLSLRAMGLMSRMLSLPDEWDYTVAGLAAICKEGRDAVRKALQELEEAGYLVREQGRDSGHFSGNDYTLYEIPRTEAENGGPPRASAPTDEPEPPLTENPSTGNPLTGKPLTGKPLTGNPTQLNKDSTKGRKNQKTEKERPPWMAKDVWAAILDTCGEDAELLSAWIDYADMRRKQKHAISQVSTVSRCRSTLDTLSKGRRAYKLGVLHKATDRGWRGLFALEPGDEGYTPPQAAPARIPAEQEDESLWL